MVYTLGIEESLMKIFAGVLVGGISDNNPKFNEIALATRTNYSRFISNFPSNIFQDEYAIFYSILAGKHIKLFSVEELKSIIDKHCLELKL